MSDPAQREELPEDGDWGDAIDSGVTYHQMGSFMPEGSYRPVPIAWIAAAFLLQVAVLFAIFLAFLSKAPIFTWALAALASFAILRWSWNRGLGEAAPFWKGLALALLGFNLALTVLGRVPG
ncbi:MAG: hypothetical protein IE933_15045 [Sphingomonadales bacterium]|nr:hypothetical protein [Sphingomonadales bacterium]MBD3773507.1 hypothetical protein [Paracoccaceae bacterium]